MRFAHFTEGVRLALTCARAEAHRLGATYVGTEHLLLGLLADDNSSTVGLLASAKVSPADLRRHIEDQVERGPSAPSDSDLPYTSRAKRVLECMMHEAEQLRVREADCEHLLLGLAAEGAGIAAQVLSSHGLGIERLRSLVGPAKPSALDNLRRWFRRRGRSDFSPPAA